MKNINLDLYFFLALSLVAINIMGQKTLPSDSVDNLLTPVPFNEVILQDQFWKPRMKTQMEELVPFALNKTEKAIQALAQTADFLAGKTGPLPAPHRYQSSDLYKVMEGVSYLLHNESNPELEERMDEIIDIIGGAQKEDGYLYVAHTTGVSRDHEFWGGGGMGDRPYSWVVHSHELYNMGHMYEGAIAYYQATGKRKWLDIAEKNARHINKVFFEGDPNYNNGKPVNIAPGHQEIELALAKMYRVTGTVLYLDMARKFLDIRGMDVQPKGEGVMASEYAQQHKPVSEQRKAVGHAVRATYMYSAMADVGALSNTSDYTPALESIWHNIVDTKMSITGGLGAIHGIEGFGPEYVLPNQDTYNETCAAVGNVFFNFRMFLNTGQAHYMDVAEISLLNNSLAGVNMEGNEFFYVNPLEADGTTPFNHGHPGRSPWFSTACCPSNIARLIPQVSGMMYSYTDDEIYSTFYGSNSASIPLQDGEVKLIQESNYPFEGTIKLTVSPGNAQNFTVKMRIPTWAHSNQFVPGDLYYYIGESNKPWSIKVNGEFIEAKLINGFVSIEREWNPGDQIELNLPMQVKFNRTIEKVSSNEGRIAVTRGPLVYAAEGVDNNGPVQRFYLNEIPDIKDIKESKIGSGLLKNVVSLSVPARESSDILYNTKIEMIPYYAWNNRGDDSMIIWLPEAEQKVQDFSILQLKYVKTSSNKGNNDAKGIIGGKRPTSSEDVSVEPWISDNKSTSEQFELYLDEELPIRSISVYWHTKSINRVNLPTAWSVDVLVDGKWKPLDIYVTDTYAMKKDQYNMIHSGSDLTTSAFRINMSLQNGNSVGISNIDIQVEE